MKYRNWSILNQPEPGKADQKRGDFLRGILGEEIAQSDFVAARGDTVLPLFESASGSPSLFLTARGFGKKQGAKDLTGDMSAPIITGICLWDRRWKLQTTEGKFYSPTYFEDREAIALEQPRIARIEIPSTFGLYYSRIISLQKKVIEGIQSGMQSMGRRFDAGSIFYHLPVREYEIYIDRLPVESRTKEVMKQQLGDFAARLKARIGEEIGDVSFISPLDDHAKEVEEIRRIDPMPLEVASFVYPYSSLGETGCIGIEDLTEYSLLASAERIARRKGLSKWLSIRSIFAILAMPFPYDHPEGDEVITLHL